MLPLFRARIGCAGWTIPAAAKHRFREGPSHLARYATRFPAVEINSSFYRIHRTATYSRWAESTPTDFRFAVKIPRRITHELRLAFADAAFVEFLAGPLALGEKLGVLLVQLPPSARFDSAIAERFFGKVRELTSVPIVCEPRHHTWFEPNAERTLLRHCVGRVAADPACVPAAAEPAGDLSLVYYRLHGSPRIYHSAYDDAYLRRLATELDRHRKAGHETWCIFDNTALGAATSNGITLDRVCNRSIHGRNSDDRRPGL